MVTAAIMSLRMSLEAIAMAIPPIPSPAIAEVTFTPILESTKSIATAQTKNLTTLLIVLITASSS
jgi:hypothetical protein